MACIISEGCFESDGKKNLRCAGLLSETNLFSRSGGDRVGFMATDHPQYDEPCAEGTHRPDSSFPTKLALRGMQVNILNAEATEHADQERIEGWVGSAADDVNRTLRKKFVAPALFAACRVRDPELMRNVVESAFTITEADELWKLCRDLGLFMKVLNDEYASCLGVLLELGLDPNIQVIPLLRMRPLGWALFHENYDIVRVLMEAGADLAQLSVCELGEIKYADCPDDIKAVLEEKGVLRKIRFVRFCYYPMCICFLPALCWTCILRPSEAKNCVKSFVRGAAFE